MVRSVQFPLFDGQIGVMPGRAPMVGRLGVGELKYTSSQGEGRYFIDGGFAQMKGQVLSILTHSAIPASKVDKHAAEQELAAAIAKVPTTEEGLAEKQHAVDRAYKLIAMSRR
jgi:F-type H+-transporting ATPase subunit epsilon